MNGYDLPPNERDWYLERSRERDRNQPLQEVNDKLAIFLGMSPIAKCGGSARIMVGGNVWFNPCDEQADLDTVLRLVERRQLRTALVEALKKMMPAHTDEYALLMASNELKAKAALQVLEEAKRA